MITQQLVNYRLNKNIAQNIIEINKYRKNPIVNNEINNLFNTIEQIYFRFIDLNKSPPQVDDYLLSAFKDLNSILTLELDINEESLAILHYFNNRSNNWKIIDQNLMSDNIYTGCWFDSIISNILHYYPTITTKLCKLLPIEAHNYNKPSDFIKDCRYAIFNKIDELYYIHPTIYKLVNITVILEMIRNKHKNIDKYINIIVNFIKKYKQIKNFMDVIINFTIIVNHYEEFMKEFKFRIDYFKYWKEHVKEYLLNSCGAITDITNELIAYTLDISIIHTYISNISKREYDYILAFIKYNPSLAYNLISPLIHIQKFINKPIYNFSNIDNNTIVLFTLNNNETNGHAMFITNGEFTKWNDINFCFDISKFITDNNMGLDDDLPF